MCNLKTGSWKKIYSLSASHNQINLCKQENKVNNDLGFYPCHRGAHVAWTWCLERE